MRCQNQNEGWTMRKIKVSVIIPVYNTEKYLEKCLDSVCNQTLSDIEIICINDASTDNSLDVLKQYAGKDSRIKIINFAENKGAAAARNAGIEIATGEYIGFVDSDDYIDIDFYEKLYTQTHTDIKTSDIILGNIVYETQNQINLFNSKLREKVRQNKFNLYCMYTMGIFNLELIKKYNIKFPPYKTAEDYLFAILTSFYANRIILVDNCFYHYVKRNLSSTDEKTFMSLKFDYINSLEYIINCINSLNYQKNDYSFLINEFIDKIIHKIINNKLYDDTKFMDKFNNLISIIKTPKVVLNGETQKTIKYLQNKDLAGLNIFRQKKKVLNSLNYRTNKIRNLTAANLNKLKALRNKHLGERCFIIGGSPSLKLLDLTKLNNEYTFSVNWGFKLRDQGLHHTTYHVMTDRATFTDDNVLLYLPDNFSDTYLISSEINFPKDKFNTIFFDFIYKDAGNTKLFETDITKPLAESRTIILLVMQLAYYMGFKKIYLIGVDLDFKKINGHAYQETDGEKYRQKNIFNKI